MNRARFKVPEQRRDLIAVAVIAIMILLAVPGLFRYQGPPMEEGFMLAFPEQILKGNMPHKDFLHLYGPGSLWLLAAVYRVFGVSLTVERLVGLVQMSAITFGMFALLRPFGRRVATPAAMVSLLILIGPLGISAMAWNGALALGICGLAFGTAAPHATGRRATAFALASGVLAGLALLFRPDLVLAVGLGFGAVLLRLRREQRAPMIWGGVGALTLYIPHFILSGVGNSFTGMFLDPVFKLRGGRTLPVPPSFGQIDGFLQKAGVLRTTGWPLPMLGFSHQIFLWFWLVPVSIAVVVFAAWRLRRREPASPRTSALWPASLFTLALITQAFQRPDTTHLAWVTGVSFPLMIAALVVLAEDVLPRRSALTRVALSLSIVAVILVGVIPFYPLRTYLDLVGQSFGLSQFGYQVERNGRTFYLGDEGGARSAQLVSDRLGELLKRGESLIVGPTDLSRTNYNDSFFYFLFPDLEAGTRYIEMDPGIADTADSGLAEELETNDWLILSDAWSGWTEPNDSAHARSTVPNQIVRDRYCMIEDAGMFQLLQRCR